MQKVLAASIGSWGFFLTGIVRGWSSPGMPSLENYLNKTSDFEMSRSDLSWIGNTIPCSAWGHGDSQLFNGIFTASLPPLCALFGSLLASIPMQYLGRRKSLIALCAPIMIGFMLIGFAVFGRHKAMIYVGRIITGLMNGAATPASQIYVRNCKRKQRNVVSFSVQACRWMSITQIISICNH